MRAVTKFLLSLSDIACQILFIIFILGMAKFYSDTLAIIGGILLLLMFLYPKEYKNIKRTILAKI